jgi:uncharacterized protein YbjQ (UPF0145 family)
VFQVRYGFVLSLSLLAAAPAIARDNATMMSIAGAISVATVEHKLSPAVHFYFGTKPDTAVAQDFGDFAAQRRSVIASDTSCQRVFLAALTNLQEHAIAVGANAVINIHSFYDQHDVSSQTEYECHKGAAVTGVALRGDFVRLAGQ